MVDTAARSATAGSATAGSTTEYAEALGDRLRNVRTQQNFSLHDVERISEGEFKASVLGAYERGERSVSVARLRGLADFYRVPLTELMPPQPSPTPAEDAAPLSGVRIDLTRLEASGIEATSTITRFVGSIQARRGDYNGRIITIRREDLRALAAVLDISTGELRDRLSAARIVPEEQVEGSEGW